MQEDIKHAPCSALQDVNGEGKIYDKGKRLKVFILLISTMLIVSCGSFDWGEFGKGIEGAGSSLSNSLSGIKKQRVKILKVTNNGYGCLIEFIDETVWKLQSLAWCSFISLYERMQISLIYISDNEIYLTNGYSTHKFYKVKL